MSEEPTKYTRKSSNKTSIIIGILSLIVVVQGMKIYFDSREKNNLRVEKSSTEEELASTTQRLNEIQAELDIRIKEIARLGGDISELQKAKEEIEEELGRTTRANGKMIKELRDKVEGYEELLRLNDKEIDRLKSLNNELYSENVTLKSQRNQLGDSISRLSESKEELASKVELASRLKAENVRIVAVGTSDRERESPFRGRQLERLKINFTLAENNVAPIEGKKIIIRIVDENNQVLFDVTRGSGTFFYNAREEFYTAAQEILFDNSRQHLTYLYDKGSPYAAGDYTLEIYCDDYKMGIGRFTVK